ncbi:hypothetical protein N7G274_000456 [Stereocaulon virgatum]|uniref:glutamate--tRNA ligase n=1 Tax=Stereocaulon virgatum TaxID=373712 RepID=A0ABR4AV85_9LECA
MFAARRTIVGSKTWTCCRCRLLSTATERRPSLKLPIFPARTRFAPSPTGYLHLGSLRTALFNYLTAKATGGQFILRVEDTDKKRTVEDAESMLYKDLKWAGLQWDEGPDIGGLYGPYKQSERTSLYQSHAKKLLDSGHAYRCFCSPERLNNLAKERSDLGLPTDYDRMCTNISMAEADERSTKMESHVVRLKMPDVAPVYNDLVYGPIGQRRKTEKSQLLRAGQWSSYEDPVLIKSDGLPTYHLANVVDDHHMRITHVIRAVEWMPSTPKHMVLYKAFDWEPPTFAHVGLLLDDSRQKLSKRGLASDIRGFERDGFFPEALLNFVALFGWSHRLGDDFINLQELVKNFDLKFTKGNTIASPLKLFHLQGRYAEKYIKEGGKEYESMIDRLHTVVAKHLAECPENQVWTDNKLRDRIAAILRLDAANYTTPNEFFARLSPLFCSQPRKEWESHPEDHVLKDNMDTIVNSFKEVSCQRWSEANLKDVLSQMTSALEAKWDGNGDVAYDLDPTAGKRRMSIVKSFLRWALFGGRSGPTLMVMMNVLGRDLSLQRIEDAAAQLDTIVPETVRTSAETLGM